MKHIQIWAEGFATNGESSGANLLFEVGAENFDEAVAKFNSTRKEGELKIDEYTRENFTSDEAFLNRRADYKFWGCALFDNEQDARKSFG